MLHKNKSSSAQGDKRRAEGNGGTSLPRSTISNRCGYCTHNENEKDIKPQPSVNRIIQPVKIPSKAARPQKAHRVAD